MRTILIALAVILASRTASAQFRNPYTGTNWNNPTSSLIDTMIRGQMMQRAYAGWSGKRQGPAPTVAAPAHQPYSKTDFKPGKQRLVVDALIAGLAQNDDQRAGLAQGVDLVFDQYEQRVRKHNVAYAVAFVIAAALLVQTGEIVDDAQGEQLAQAVNDALAANPAFANASAPDRQKLYEACVTLGGLIVLFHEVGKQDAASANAAKVLAKQSLAMIGIK